eukprot:172310-Pleurochrysis_carterae.AAC.1
MRICTCTCACRAQLRERPPAPRLLAEAADGDSTKSECPREARERDVDRVLHPAPPSRNALVQAVRAKDICEHHDRCESHEHPGPHGRPKTRADMWRVCLGSLRRRRRHRDLCTGRARLQIVQDARF